MWRMKNTYSNRERKSQKVSAHYHNKPYLCIVYFLVKGSAGYVIPRLDNKAYVIIQQGDHFGHVDLASDRSFLELDFTM